MGNKHNNNDNNDNDNNATTTTTTTTADDNDDNDNNTNAHYTSDSNQTMYGEDNAFLRILDGRLRAHKVLETEHAVAFLDGAPLSRGSYFLESHQFI